MSTTLSITWSSSFDDASSQQFAPITSSHIVFRDSDSSALAHDHGGGDGPTDVYVDIFNTTLNQWVQVFSHSIPEGLDFSFHNLRIDFAGQEFNQIRLRSNPVQGQTFHGFDGISVILNDAPPTATGDSKTTNEDSPLTITSASLLSNDTDPDGDPLSIVSNSVSASSNGTVVVNDNGTPDDLTDDTITYTPDANFNGPDSFTYEVADGNGDTDTATVNLSVNSVNDAPTVANIISDQTIAEDAPLAFQFAVNTFTDVDVDDSLTYSATRSDDSALPTWLRFNAATRTFRGTPTSNEVGTLSLKVTATDESNATVSETFNLTVAPTLPNPMIRSDFNGDDQTDILWRNSVTGANVVWRMDGTTLYQRVYTTSIADLNWSIGETDDFNGDDQTDILWRNSATGANAVWLMDGITLDQSVSITSTTDPNWSIGGTGDFNGDDRTDILWRNGVTGQNAMWLMNGTTLDQSVSTTPITDPNWSIGGTDDFNGDDQTDILWRNRLTGKNNVWLMDDTTLDQGVSITPITNPNWSIGGTGDYNIDGQTDILWRNGATGQDAMWLMNGTTLDQNVYTTPVVNLSWQIGA